MSDQVQMRARAVVVTDGKLRKMYLELARQWCQLAEDPELLDRKRRLDYTVGSKELRLQ
jgi:hypothetical protein